MHNSKQLGSYSSNILEPDSLSGLALEEYLEAIKPFDRDLLKRKFGRQSKSYTFNNQEWESVPEEDHELHDLFQDPELNSEIFSQKACSESSVGREQEYSRIETKHVLLYEEPREAFG